MRRISIGSANALVLMYAVDDVTSFRNVSVAIKALKRQMSDIWDEITAHRRADLPTLPVVIVGNKHDLSPIKITDATCEAWLKTRADADSLLAMVPTSVTQGRGVITVFRTLLRLSKFAEEQGVKLKDMSPEILQSGNAVYNTFHCGR